MHFRRLIPALCLVLTSIYTLQLQLDAKLGFYIHPRYTTFTITMAVICFVITVAYSAVKDHKSGHAHKYGLGILPLIIILCSAWLLAPNTLSSSTAAQRQIGQVSGSGQTSEISKLLANSTRSLSLVDWSRILGSNQEESYYLNRPVNISGFVYDSGGGSDQFTVARFILTCCVIDAQPVGVDVYLESWQDSFKPDSWVEIEGKFEKKDDKILLVPSKINEIDRPVNPYAN